MLCLGIETSCDETAIALVQDGRLVDSLIASQANIHSLFGGVVPELASREHYRFLGPLYDRLMRQTGIHPSNIDAVAVTRGPGLLGSLLTGVAFAKGLALALDRPVIGINHLHAHLLATGLERELAYPALGVLASGGHTHLYHIRSPISFQEIGRTMDDAAGEVYDKVGNFLGLRYPAGAKIDALAQKGVASDDLPCPYLDNSNLDFSFSGLKTAAINLARDSVDSEASLNDFCATLNNAIAKTIATKAERALNKIAPRSIWLAGGVAANSCIRSRLKILANQYGLEFLAPSPSLCSDNAAMIAYNGWLLLKNGLAHDLDFETLPRGKIIPDDWKSSQSLDSEG